MRRAATVLLTAALTSAGLATLAPPAPATGAIVPRDLTITVTNLGPEKRTCYIDADLYIPGGASRNTPAPALLATNGSAAPRRTRPTSPRASASRGT